MTEILQNVTSKTVNFVADVNKNVTYTLLSTDISTEYTTEYKDDILSGDNTNEYHTSEIIKILSHLSIGILLLGLLYFFCKQRYRRWLCGIFFTLLYSILILLRRRRPAIIGNDPESQDRVNNSSFNNNSSSPKRRNEIQDQFYTDSIASEPELYNLQEVSFVPNYQCYYSTTSV